jgi:hypothetical protein
LCLQRLSIVVPQAVLVSDQQFVQIRDHIVVLRVDRHDRIWRTIHRFLNRRPMDDEQGRDYGNSDSGSRHQSAWIKPVTQPPNALRALSNGPDNVASEKGRKPRLRGLAKEVPQLLVVFAFHFLAD